jgi:ribonuclease HII
MKTIRLHKFFQNSLTEAGVDEAGRGCLAGPVFAAAVILPAGEIHPLLNDSKRMTPRSREQVRLWIESHAVDWAVAQVSNSEIDEINILQASILAMHRALDQLNVRPEMVLVDGNRFHPYGSLPYQCIIGGDAIYASIAAASVIAKTTRDAFMSQISMDYPGYNWAKNKGYPTREHRNAIAENGITPWHRRTFHLTDDQLSLQF